MQSENVMLADKHKIEKEQNAQLRNQVAHLLHSEQDQKLQMQQRDSTIQTLQVGFRSILMTSHIFMCVCLCLCMDAYTFSENKTEKNELGLNLSLRKAHIHSSVLQIKRFHVYTVAF